MKRAASWLRDHWASCLLVAAGTLATVAYFALRPKPPVEPILADAEAAVRSKDFDTARRLLDGAADRYPGDEEVLLARSRLAVAEGQRELALELLRRVSDSRPTRAARARFLEGAILLDANRAREAEASLRRAVELDPLLTEPHFPLRRLYIVQLRRHAMRSYLAFLRRVRHWEIGDLSDYLLVGHSVSWEVPVSVEQMAAYVRADPEDLESRLALAHYHASLGQHDDAARVGGEAVERFPNEPRGWALLADAHLSLGDTDAAADVLERVPAECPRHAWLWRSNGRLAEETGNVEHAVACYREAIRLDPEDERAAYRLAVGLQSLGRSDEAAGYFDRARVLNQLVVQITRVAVAMREGQAAVVDALMGLGRSYVEIDQPHLAALCFAQVVQLDPANRAARELFGEASEQSRLRQAIASDATLDFRGQAAGADSVRRRRPDEAAASHRVAAPNQCRLRDVAVDAGLAFQYFTGETGNKYLIESMGGGVAVLDFDGDGWPDLYFTQGARLPADPSDATYSDRVFRNQADDAFEDVTELARLGDRGYSLGCAAGDWDDDGFADLVVANYGPSRMYQNNGDGTFSDVTRAAGMRVAKMSLSAALADLDRDGDLDLYVVNYLTKVQAFRNALGEPFTGNPQLFDAEQDVLYLNRGDGVLEDVTGSSGVAVPNGKGLGVVVADLDNDAWPDIYVANDTTPNFLFQNRGGSGGELQFVEQGMMSGTALNSHGVAEAGMGIACADLDRNGLLDLHVTNFFGETNSLYLNRGNLRFIDATRVSGLAVPTVSMLGFGTQALDVDRDGWLDLFVANGHIDDVAGADWKMRPQLFRNLGAARFADVSSESGEFFRGEYLGRGAARLDWNRDGRPDLVVVHQDRPAALLVNETSDANHSVTLELVGTSSNRDAVNARIEIHAGGETQVHEVCGGDGFLATNERRQVIGVGSASRIERLEIRWPSGRRDSWNDLPVDCVMVLVEGRAL